MAIQPLVRQCYFDPIEKYSTIVIGIINDAPVKTPNGVFTGLNLFFLGLPPKPVLVKISIDFISLIKIY